MADTDDLIAHLEEAEDLGWDETGSGLFHEAALALREARTRADELERAIVDVCTLLPPERWRLLKPATKSTFRTIDLYADDGEAADG